MSSTFISAYYIFLIFLYITFHKFIICLSRLSAHHIFNIETSNAILSVHTKAFCSFIEFLYANTPILIFSTLYIIFYVYTFINIYIFFFKHGIIAAIFLIKFNQELKEQIFACISNLSDSSITIQSYYVLALHYRDLETGKRWYHQWLR